MADKKISALTAATTPLAGTEVLPIVQSGNTVKVAVSDLTAGRAVAMATGSTVGSAVAATNVQFNVNGVVNKAGRFSFQESGSDKWLIGNGAASENGNFEIYDAVNGNNISITHTGNITMPGNLIQGTAAKGVNFTANTPAAGMTSQLLNWYEEGTWTPTDASGAGLTFTSATGRYTRMGNVVFLFGYVQYPTTASGANASIGGLPFTVNASAAATQGGVTYSQVATVRSVGVQSSTTTATVYTLAGGVATNADLSATALYFNSTYFV